MLLPVDSVGAGSAVVVLTAVAETVDPVVRVTVPTLDVVTIAVGVIVAFDPVDTVTAGTDEAVAMLVAATTEPVCTVGAGRLEVVAIAVAATRDPVWIVGLAIVVVVATVVGLTCAPVVTVGAGTDAAVAMVVAVTRLPVCTAGAGTVEVVAMAAGVAVASVPPALTLNTPMMPVRDSLICEYVPPVEVEPPPSKNRYEAPMTSRVAAVFCSADPMLVYEFVHDVTAEYVPEPRDAPSVPIARRRPADVVTVGVV